MPREIKRMSIAVPEAAKLAAGRVYSAHSKNAADDLSFTPGFLDELGNEWAVACWAVDKNTIAQFDTLRAAYPGARVATWLEAESTPEQELAKLRLSKQGQQDRK